MAPLRLETEGLEPKTWKTNETKEDGQDQCVQLNQILESQKAEVSAKRQEISRIQSTKFIQSNNFMDKSQIQSRFTNYGQYIQQSGSISHSYATKNPSKHVASPASCLYYPTDYRILDARTFDNSTKPAPSASRLIISGNHSGHPP